MFLCLPPLESSSSLSVLCPSGILLLAFFCERQHHSEKEKMEAGTIKTQNLLS